MDEVSDAVVEPSNVVLRVTSSAICGTDLDRYDGRTGWHATELTAVRPARTVAVFGADAVGLLAAHSPLLKGAAEV